MKILIKTIFLILFVASPFVLIGFTVAYNQPLLFIPAIILLILVLRYADKHNVASA